MHAIIVLQVLDQAILMIYWNIAQPYHAPCTDQTFGHSYQGFRLEDQWPTYRDYSVCKCACGCWIWETINVCLYCICALLHSQHVIEQYSGRLQRQIKQSAIDPLYNFLSCVSAICWQQLCTQQYYCLMMGYVRNWINKAHIIHSNYMLINGMDGSP